MTVIGQWAQCKLTAIAPNTATLSITAATFSGGNVTYTYTVTQGDVSVPISGGTLYVIITGMKNTGNNGHFTASTFGSGTFTVANASGVTETGSSGTGVCPSDSGLGVVVFGSGQSSYFFHRGTNSWSGDGRTGFTEFWKAVNNVGTNFGGTTGTNDTPPSVNDVIGVSVETQNSTQVVTAWTNGLLPANFNSGAVSIADSSLSSGSQGLVTFSVGGPDEYNWSKWASSGGGGISPTAPGNSGTQAGSYAAGNILQTVLQTDSFVYSNGDLHTKNANWVYNGTSSFTVSSDKVYYSSTTQNPGLAYRTDITPDNDQYSEVTAVVTGVSGTQNCGPAVRISTSAVHGYYVAFANDLFILARANSNGSATALASSTNRPVTGDVIRLVVRGSTLVVYQNGIAIMSATDATYTSGAVGIFGAGNATINGFSAWNGGNYSWQQTQSDTFGHGPALTGYVGLTQFSAAESVPNLTNASIIVVGNAFAPAVNYSGLAQAFWAGSNASGNSWMQAFRDFANKRGIRGG